MRPLWALQSISMTLTTRSGIWPLPSPAWSSRHLRDTHRAQVTHHQRLRGRQTKNAIHANVCLQYLHIGLDVSSWTAPPHDPRQRCKTLKSLSPTHHQQFSIAGTRLTHDWRSLARKCKNARHAKIFCPATNHHPVTRDPSGYLYFADTRKDKFEGCFVIRLVLSNYMSPVS